MLAKTFFGSVVSAIASGLYLMGSTASAAPLSKPTVARRDVNATNFPNISTGSVVLGSDNTYVNSSIYDSSLRPQLHFSPATGFMNDPNGLVYANGKWHLFYQYNPAELAAGNQHWGHATLSNGTTILMFSGSAVVDRNNTSGFFNNTSNAEENIVLMFTEHTDYVEQQSLAYTTDGGKTFTKYSGNPVIDIGSTQFRDPKVFWHPETEKWIMVAAHSQDYQIGIFGSKDLKSWDELSRVTRVGYLGYQYECPGLAQVPVEGSDEKRWVLTYSINPGSPLGGSIMEYFVGDFNGTHFVADDAATRFVDTGKDFYAGQMFDNTGDEVIGITWASNWEYTNDVPADHFRSAMTVPRRYKLRSVPVNPMFNDTLLVQEFVNTSAVHDKELFNSPINYSSSMNGAPIAVPTAGAFEFTAEVFVNTTTGLKSNDWAVIDFYSNDTFKSEKLSLGFRPNDGMLYVRRADAQKSWYNPLFTGSSNSFISIPSANSTTKFHGIVDRGVFELLINDGQQSITNTYFLEKGNVIGSVVFSTAHENITFTSASVDSFKSIW
ncbi:invertase [Schizosaccharomyces japonicus yFS275]|uniref:Invertase n=1 Tax=Schizosaccharomyces japonicus (strain yFS275 / FY16936) TaxID=402676 RepID=B6K6H0_SCHJY|nr:invertase [Schizosaccharomyces japonicus yFS275]EEB09124.1 invertase [Schizosaccharomyces japonicus yFS275]